MSNDKHMRLLWAPAVLFLMMAGVFVTAPFVHAVEGGSSNYLPGFYGDFTVAVAPDPGFYPQVRLYYYAADAGKTVRGGRIRGELDLDLGMVVVAGMKVTKKTLFGGRYAFGGYMPLVYADLTSKLGLGPRSFSEDDKRTAFGDLGIIPVSLYWNFGNFSINAYEQIVVPTGQYDKNAAVNAGMNIWTFDTEFAVTYLDQKKGHEISAVFGYLYSTKNNATNYRNGQEFHADYMLNQFLSETFAIGLQGFYYKQITGDSGSGAILGTFKGEAAGIGPALMWTTKITNVDLVVSAKWLHEFHAKRRLKGDHLLLNLTLGF